MIFLPFQITLGDWGVDIVIVIVYQFLTRVIDTAYTKSILDGKWYNCDDSHVSVTSGKIVTSAAYLLFYKKRHSSRGQISVEELLPIISSANNRLRQKIHQQEAERQRDLDSQDERNRRTVNPFAHSLIARSEEPLSGEESARNSTTESTNVSSPAATVSNETAEMPDSFQDTVPDTRNRDVDELSYEGDKPISEYP